MEPSSKYHFNLEELEWLDYLKSFGYVVVRNIASIEDVDKASACLHRDLKSLRLPAHGLVANLAQSEGAWSIRGLSKLKNVFSEIWKTDELIVSMDAIIAWRKWNGYDLLTSSNELPSPPRTEGLHLDQNPFDKPYLDCIQGMMPLLPVTEESGGLEVVPLSHLEENKTEFKSRYPSMKGRGDWCPLNDDDPLYRNAVLLTAEPGDLILWDSRTIHGGRVGTGEKNNQSNVGNDQNKERVTSEVPLVRLSVCVAMTPRSKANDDVLKRRKEGFDSGVSFNHCPHEAGTSTGTIKQKLPPDCKLPELDESQRSLL